MACRPSALRGQRSLRDMYTGFAQVLPLVGTKIDRDQRERHPKGYTSHEVTAARAGRFLRKKNISVNRRAWPE
jgi:hypothetical protein